LTKLASIARSGGAASCGTIPPGIQLRKVQDGAIGRANAYILHNRSQARYPKVSAARRRTKLSLQMRGSVKV
jgi:hypothetical protein